MFMRQRLFGLVKIDFFRIVNYLCILAAGNSFAHVYDPKNGENVSSFIGKLFIY
jgi:hypothetical protein